MVCIQSPLLDVSSLCHLSLYFNSLLVCSCLRILPLGLFICLEGYSQDFSMACCLTLFSCFLKCHLPRKFLLVQNSPPPRHLSNYCQTPYCVLTFCIARITTFLSIYIFSLFACSLFVMSILLQYKPHFEHGLHLPNIY